MRRRKILSALNLKEKYIDLGEYLFKFLPQYEVEDLVFKLNDNGEGEVLYFTFKRKYLGKDSSEISLYISYECSYNLKNQELRISISLHNNTYFLESEEGKAWVYDTPAKFRATISGRAVGWALIELFQKYDTFIVKTKGGTASSQTDNINAEQDNQSKRKYSEKGLSYLKRLLYNTLTDYGIDNLICRTNTKQEELIFKFSYKYTGSKVSSSLIIAYEWHYNWLYKTLSVLIQWNQPDIVLMRTEDDYAVSGRTISLEDIPIDAVPNIIIIYIEELNSLKAVHAPNIFKSQPSSSDSSPRNARTRSNEARSNAPRDNGNWYSTVTSPSPNAKKPKNWFSVGAYDSSEIESQVNMSSQFLEDKDNLKIFLDVLSFIE
jgi:hypothetical protein